MSLDQWITFLGTVAALCTTVAFVPQILRVRRQGGRDLSYGMLALYLAGVLLWLGYGLLIGARAVILANVAGAVLVSVTLALKRAAERGSSASGGRSPRRLRIAIDMDEVIADSLGKHVRAYNHAFGARLTRADLGDRPLEEAVPPSRTEATEELVLAPGFFRDLEPIEGSREVVRQLAERYEVFVATAAMEVQIQAVCLRERQVGGQAMDPPRELVGVVPQADRRQQEDRSSAAPISTMPNPTS